jgi:hypothetical protein
MLCEIEKIGCWDREISAFNGLEKPLEWIDCM